MAYDQKPKFTINVFTLYSHNMSALYCAVPLKKAYRLLLSGLAIDNQDSFESFEADLFTSNHANKTKVCAMLFSETSKKEQTR